MAKPVIVIIVAIAVAGGAAFYMSKQSTETAAPAVSSPAASVAPGGGHIRGPENARVALVEFGDYQCPSCGYYAPIVNEVLRRFPKDVRLEFHHFPLVGIHPWAMAAALAAEAAGEQGKFWEMHDMLYANQEKWSRSANAEAEFVSMATQLGLNIDQFMRSTRSPDIQQRVLADVTRATNAHVNATPTFYINGEMVTSKPRTPDDFSKLIQDALQKQDRAR